ncbi:LrgB family protein [Ureibacillus thermophilus]|jgi:predicted murein hydrolase (TIGR00659 family)|uniref:LrgB family protein n=1 Tax=Ureibacillus thermophilus TaxID=367743 RepID=A0A4P6UTN1_9BACL|nr:MULTISPECIES: LrgB family protein [Bacillales]QBK25491.1 LrgB family protein [Ureibacillus thermophilus]
MVELNAIIYIISTVLIFLIMMRLYKRFPFPFLLPILTTTIVLVVLIILLHIPYNEYMEGGKWIQNLLGPAVVALAYPLYNQRQLVAKYKYTIMLGIVFAMMIGLISVCLGLEAFHEEKDFILTALPKSLTTPIAMQVSETIGGIPPLTAVLVMVAGFTGALFGPMVYKLGKIDSPISRGISMGSASHGVGISRLKDYGEEDLSIGSVSMSLSAVIGAILCPIFVFLFF